MPPSTIPPAQLRSMMADFRGEHAHAGAAAAEPLPGYVEPRRRIAGAFAWLMVGAVLGIGVGLLGPRVEALFAPAPVSAAAPLLMAVTPTPAPVAAQLPTPPTPPSAQDPKALVAVQAAAPVVVPKPHLAPQAVAPLKASAKAAAPPRKSAARAKPVNCARGGPCGRADVQAAERRLRIAYDAARRAGVSNAVLSGYRERWERASGSARSKPRATVGAYRSMASELSAKTRARRR